MIFSYLQNMQSHPSWVCGLKQEMRLRCLRSHQSHPSWVCGLKPKSEKWNRAIHWSHPSWVCGLKHADAHPSTTSGRHTLRGCVD